jgi:hypothetical protein
MARGPSVLTRVAEFLWTMILLGMLAGLGWVAFYYLYWKYRLPQEHVLTDDRGRRLDVRVVDVSSKLVKFELLSDGSVHYYPLAYLSDQDQEFLKGLSGNLTVQYPFQCTLTLADGSVRKVLLVARSDTLVQYLSTTNNLNYYLPISFLSPEDQAMINALPPGLFPRFPLAAALTDRNGHVVSALISGRSDDAVKFTYPGDSEIRTYPIGDLVPENQAFLRLLLETNQIPIPMDLPENFQELADQIAQLKGRADDLTSDSTNPNKFYLQRVYDYQLLEQVHDELVHVTAEYATAKTNLLAGMTNDGERNAYLRQFSVLDQEIHAINLEIFSIPRPHG